MSSGSSNSRLTEEERDRRGFSHSSESGSRFLQLDVRHPQEKRRDPTGFQLTQAQRVYGPAPLQDGNNQGSSASYYIQRLFGIDRLNRRFSSYSYPSRVSKVPQVLLEVQDLPMVYHTLWSLLNSVCIHQSLSPHSRLGSLKTDQTFGILRRLVTDSTYQGNRFAADTTGSQQIAPIGLDDQRNKINLGSDSAIRTPRFRIGHNYYEGGTPEEKSSRLEEINFTSTTTSFETDSQTDTQFNDAATVVTVCDPSGSFVYETPTLLQKSGSEVSFGLGHASTTRQRIDPRADMVAHQFGEMERSVIYPNLPTGNNICRRERHGLGMLVEQADHSWLLDSNGSESINQLARTEGSLVGDASIPVSEEHHHLDQNRQSHKFSVYQQTGRYSLPASPQLSDRSVELVPRTQYNHTSPTYSRDSQQGCRLRVSSSVPEEPMANSPLGVCSSPTTLGTVRRRSVCGPYDLPPSKIRVLASRFRSVACRRLYSELENSTKPFHQSSVESDLPGTSQDSPGPSLSSSTGGAVLDKCDVVSSPLLHGQSTSSFSAPFPSPINNGQQWPSSWNESALEAVRVECIRSKFVTKGLSESAIQSLMLKYITKSATSKNYLKYQYMFIEWCSQQHITVSTFTSAHLINFLSHVKELYHWQPSTLKLVRSAITHLNAQPNTISKCNLINGFISSLVQQQDPVRIHRTKISLQPAICYAKSIPSSITTPWSVLQSKLAFLLGVTTFMRPSDLARISLESCKISGSHLFFQVVAPKETRQRRRIIKDYTVRSHTDPDLCPVRLFQILQTHPIWRSVAGRSTALFFSDRGDPLSSGTLSKWLHRRFISKVTSEPTTLRSLASSAALDAGISKDDIIALGSWRNSHVFDNHYRRNHMLSVDFTSTLLTYPAGTNIPTSGLDSSYVELPVVSKSDDDDDDDDDLYMDAMDSLDEH